MDTSWRGDVVFKCGGHHLSLRQTIIDREGNPVDGISYSTDYIMMTAITDNDYIIDDTILTEPAYQAIRVGGVGL